MNRNKRRIHHYICSVFIFVFLLVGSACENPVVTDTHIEIAETNTQIEIQENQIAEAFFNPQPEPPPKVYEFEIVGDPAGDWTGRFPGFREGHIEVELLNSMMRGKTVNVVQTWMIVPPEPIFPPEPIVPPEPVVPPDPIEPIHISLKGLLNFANGNVVLNGLSDELGVNVHIRGEVMTLESGDISIGGELMFNPQPEPPPNPAISGHRDR